MITHMVGGADAAKTTPAVWIVEPYLIRCRRCLCVYNSRRHRHRRRGRRAITAEILYRRILDVRCHARLVALRRLSQRCALRRRRRAHARVVHRSWVVREVGKMVDRLVFTVPFVSLIVRGHPACVAASAFEHVTDLLAKRAREADGECVCGTFFPDGVLAPRSTLLG